MPDAAAPLLSLPSPSRAIGARHAGKLQAAAGCRLSGVCRHCSRINWLAGATHRIAPQRTTAKFQILLSWHPGILSCILQPASCTCICTCTCTLQLLQTTADTTTCCGPLRHCVTLAYALTGDSEARGARSLCLTRVVPSSVITADCRSARIPTISHSHSWPLCPGCTLALHCPLLQRTALSSLYRYRQSIPPFLATTPVAYAAWHHWRTSRQSLDKSSLSTLSHSTKTFSSHSTLPSARLSSTPTPTYTCNNLQLHHFDCSLILSPDPLLPPPSPPPHLNPARHSDRHRLALHRPNPAFLLDPVTVNRNQPSSPRLRQTALHRRATHVGRTQTLTHRLCPASHLAAAAAARPLLEHCWSSPSLSKGASPSQLDTSDLSDTLPLPRNAKRRRQPKPF